MDKIKTLHDTNPSVHSIPVLASQFKISSHAVKRIVRSSFLPDALVSMRQDLSKKRTGTDVEEKIETIREQLRKVKDVNRDPRYRFIQ